MQQTKGPLMTASAPGKTRDRLNRPNDEAIRQERREQDQTVVALRRMLAKTRGTNEELFLFSAV